MFDRRGDADRATAGGDRPAGAELAGACWARAAVPASHAAITTAKPDGTLGRRAGPPSRPFLPWWLIVWLPARTEFVSGLGKATEKPRRNVFRTRFRRGADLSARDGSARLAAIDSIAGDAARSPIGRRRGWTVGAAAEGRPSRPAAGGGRRRGWAPGGGGRRRGAAAPGRGSRCPAAVPRATRRPAAACPAAGRRREPPVIGGAIAAPPIAAADDRGDRRRADPGISRSMAPSRTISRIVPRLSASRIGSTPGSSRVETRVSTPETASSWYLGSGR